MKKRFFVVAALLIASQLQAQDSTALDEVVVTANKYPQKQSETGKVITVINRREIEQNSGKTLNELLNMVAGTTIIGANNVLGTNNTVSIRGASAGNVLILVDGIPVNDPSVITNYFDINLLPLTQVERIEILKGGQSTLYGSDAVAGVINIIMRKPEAGKINLQGAVSGGSYGTFQQQAGINGRLQKLGYTINYNHINSVGFSAATDASGTGDFDKDGFNQHSIDSRFSLQANKAVQLWLSIAYSQYRTDLDAAGFTDEKDYTVNNKNLRPGLGMVYTHRQGALHINYNFNYVQRYYFDDSVYKSSPYTDWSKADYIGRSHFAELYNNWKWTNWELLAGADYRYNNTDQYYESQSPASPPYTTSPSIYLTSIDGKKMSQFSPYGSLVYSKNRFSMEAGARLNFHSEYGSNLTATLNPSYRIQQRVKLFANFYSAFKTPTLYQLFDPSSGNIDLKPEQSLVAEAGLELLPAGGFHGRATGFYRHSTDAITYVYDPSTYIGSYANVNKQSNYGIELELGYTTGKLNFSGNYTYTDGRIKSGLDNTGVEIGKDTSYFNLYRIPKHALNLQLGVQATKSWYISVQSHTVSKRDEYVYAGAPQALKAYTLVNVYTEYRMGHGFNLFLNLQNILDKKYVDILGYNSKRFNFMTGVQFRL